MSGHPALADDLPRSLRELRREGVAVDAPDFVARLVRAVETVVRDLDALPRTDPFWANTNGRATWHKVSRYCEERLARDPGDQAARWTLLAQDLEGGLCSGLDLLAGELATRPELVVDVVATAEWVWLRVGVSPWAALRRVLDGLPPASRAALTRLAGSSDERTGRAARAALAVLAGRPFADAVGLARWDRLLTALLDRASEGPDGAGPPRTVEPETARRAGEVVAAARTLLAEDPTAVRDLVSAAWWCEVEVETPATDAARDLLATIDRARLEEFAAGAPPTPPAGNARPEAGVNPRAGTLAEAARTALRVLDGGPLLPLH
ncbi:hypothetical protein [Plantactinospora sonchi]|uniref:Uncharacterized protein n=1 Tax=Plantactinospora sonchi TaxID=1544735 RepID=A0ABU7RZI2_9ACTN